MAKIGIFFMILAIIVGAVFSQDCSSPLVTGPCRAAFRRYGFDTEIGKCRQFTYGGCGGNDNRYDTIEQCQDACEGDC